MLATRLGQGGFGAVFLGTIDGEKIAVKQMAKDSGQGDSEFFQELTVLASVRHQHILPLLGFSVDVERCLVYPLMTRGSLDDRLRDATALVCIRRVIIGMHLSTSPLDSRLDLCACTAAGACRGLAALHSRQLIHRDIKSSNILLDGALNAKLADMGCARQLIAGTTHVVTLNLVGTNGYLDPEYLRVGALSTKSDVYGMGVVLLELLTGQQVTSAWCSSVYPPSQF